MKATEKRLLEILDPSGLAVLIRGCLDRTEMVRIANASRVSVPGMRNRAVSLERLSEALADKYVAEGPARRLLFKALSSAARTAIQSYRKLTAEEIRARLSDTARVRADTELPRLLFLLISEPREAVGADEIRAVIAEMLLPQPAKDAGVPAQPSSDDELQALRREKAELSRRTADLVALVDRLRERDRRFREEAAQRKFDVNNLKLQLGKSRKERDTLEKELRSLTAKLDQIDRKPPSAADLGEKIGGILSETKRLGGTLEKLHSRLAGPRDDRSPVAAAQVTKAAEGLRQEAQSLRKEFAEGWGRVSRLLEESSERLVAIEHALEADGVSTRGGREEMERVGVFVDVQNMFYAARGQNARLDFDVLLQTITRGRRLVRAIAYVVETKEIDQSGFIALLQQKRYEVRRKDLKVRSDGSFKGDWDMGIALDALEMAASLDVVVLVTGDGDFTGLVQKVKVIGPKVEIYSFPRNTAKELREAADKFVPIDRRMLIRMPEPAKQGPGPAGAAAS